MESLKDKMIVMAMHFNNPYKPSEIDDAIVEALKKRSEDVNYQPFYSNERTLLMIAIDTLNYHVMTSIASHPQINFNLKDANGRTAMDHAKDTNDKTAIDIVKYITSEEFKDRAANGDIRHSWIVNTPPLNNNVGVDAVFSHMYRSLQ